MMRVDYRPNHEGLKRIITLVLKEKYIFWWWLEPPFTIACIHPPLVPTW
jgi:hypothetical protein